MAVRGQRFELDLESEHHDKSDTSPRPPTGPTLLRRAFLKDITERSITSAKPPPPPELKGSTSGFPAHKRRVRASIFKQQQQQQQQQEHSRDDATLFVPKIDNAAAPSSASETPHEHAHSVLAEKAAIDEDNKRRLAQMSAEEIEQERRELFAGLSPSLIERLLKRANIDEGRADSALSRRSASMERPWKHGREHRKTSQNSSSVQVTRDLQDHRDPVAGTSQCSHPDADAVPATLPDDLHPTSAQTPLSLPLPLPLPLPPGIHFPHPPATPALDPSDPAFLENLRSKYFPHLPADPSKLAWMAPIPTEGSPADQYSPYNPSQEAVHASSIRFDFRGRLIPPRLARQIPATKGLHHHGLAPEAAGYTLPELAHLSRSSFPAQRCVAYQTLGRVLFRLGRGDFGDEEEELYQGLWKCLEDGRVLDTLLAEAGRDDGRGNRSCKITATEAVWLWRKGGGKKWKAK